VIPLHRIFIRQEKQLQDQQKQKGNKILDMDLSDLFLAAEQNKNDGTITFKTVSSPHNESSIDFTSPNASHHQSRSPTTFNNFLSTVASCTSFKKPPKINPANTSNKRISLSRAMTKDILTEAHIARLVEQSVILPETHTVAIPEFQNLIGTASLMSSNDVNLAEIKQRLSSIYALSETDRRH
jgi:hypothetical protein